MAAVADFELSREQIRCTVCGGAAERIRYSRTPPPVTFLESALRPTEAVECPRCESRDAAVAYQKFGGEPPKELPPSRRAELERARSEIRMVVSRASDPEVWNASAKEKRRRGREKQATRDRRERFEAFRTKVWPALAPLYNRPDWMASALALCRDHGIAVSKRQLERLLEVGRWARFVPPR